MTTNNMSGHDKMFYEDSNFYTKGMKLARTRKLPKRLGMVYEHNSMIKKSAIKYPNRKRRSIKERGELKTKINVGAVKAEKHNTHCEVCMDECETIICHSCRREGWQKCLLCNRMLRPWDMTPSNHICIEIN